VSVSKTIKLLKEIEKKYGDIDVCLEVEGYASKESCEGSSFRSVSGILDKVGTIKLCDGTANGKRCVWLQGIRN